MFWIQTPLAALAGLGVYFSLPATFRPEKKDEDVSTLSKLKQIDYLGAFLLVSHQDAERTLLPKAT